MKKMIDYRKKMIAGKLNLPESLNGFSGVPTTEKSLYWTGSPWNVFRLLAEKQK